MRPEGEIIVTQVPDAPDASSRLAQRLEARRETENFPVASLLLPRSVRSKVRAIYRLARLADDLADEPGIKDALRLACLGELMQVIEAPPDVWASKQLPSLEALGLRNTARHILAQWFAEVGTQWIMQREMRLMLAAFHWDARGFEPLDWEQFDRYCRGSAATVGRMLLAIHGCTQPAAIAASDAICLALQRINMLQDVAIDAHRNRVYIPGTVLRGWGVTRVAWLGLCREGSLGPELAQRLLDEALLQGKQLRRNQHLAAMLPFRLGLEVRAILAGGNSIVRQFGASPDAARRRPALDGRLTWPMRLQIAGDFLLGLPGGSGIRALPQPQAQRCSP
jgi:phytoene/squalene synthetase